MGSLTKDGDTGIESESERRGGYSQGQRLAASQ